MKLLIDIFTVLGISIVVLAIECFISGIILSTKVKYDDKGNRLEIEEKDMSRTMIEVMYINVIVISILLYKEFGGF